MGDLEAELEEKHYHEDKPTLLDSMLALQELLVQLLARLEYTPTAGAILSISAPFIHVGPSNLFRDLMFNFRLQDDF